MSLLTRKIFISQQSVWFGKRGSIASLLQLIYEQCQDTVDHHEFLYWMIQRRWDLSVDIALDELGTDDFRVFSEVVRHVYRRMLMDWTTNPTRESWFVYDVGGLVSLLSHDQRSDEYLFDPILHKITSDTYYSIPLDVSRFIWANSAAFFQEKSLPSLAEILCKKIDHIREGFDFTTLDGLMLTELEMALKQLRANHDFHGRMFARLSRPACDPYLNELIALVGSLRAMLEAESGAQHSSF